MNTSFLILTGSVVSKPRILGRLQGGCYGEGVLFLTVLVQTFFLILIGSDASELRLLGRLQVVVMGIPECTGADFLSDNYQHAVLFQN